MPGGSFCRSSITVAARKLSSSRYCDGASMIMPRARVQARNSSASGASTTSTAPICSATPDGSRGARLVRRRPRWRVARKARHTHSRPASRPVSMTNSSAPATSR